ncbi:MAG TPA: SRPBCC family protein, partial [Methylomirabilota bacterium]|nr:SRPBCC family protein [Methylomirabilota bacterium]
VPQRLAYWYGVEMQAEIEVAGGAEEFTAGQKVRISGKLAGKIVTHTVVITECQWGKVFEWRFLDAHGVRGTERWEFEPVQIGGDAGTRVRMINDYQVSGFLAELTDKLLTRRSLALRNRDYLARLKRLAEHSSEHNMAT